MKKLKRFLWVLVLFCLVSWPSWSDVVLTDEEAAKVLTSLENCNGFTENFVIQSNLWLKELGNLRTKLDQSETLQKSQQIYFDQQLKDQNRKVIKVALITGAITLVVGLIGGAIFVIAVQ